MEENKIVEIEEVTETEKKEGIVSKAKGFVRKHGKKVLIGAGIVGAFVLGLAAGGNVPAVIEEGIETTEDSTDESTEE